MSRDPYSPCFNGLHICGCSADGREFVTVANIRTASADLAIALFDSAKREFGASKEEGDLVVDLMVRGECDHDFWINRQMIQRLQSTADAMTEARK